MSTGAGSVPPLGGARGGATREPAGTKEGIVLMPRSTATCSEGGEEAEDVDTVVVQGITFRASARPPSWGARGIRGSPKEKHRPVTLRIQGITAHRGLKGSSPTGSSGTALQALRQRWVADPAADHSALRDGPLSLLLRGVLPSTAAPRHFTFTQAPLAKQTRSYPPWSCTN